MEWSARPPAGSRPTPDDAPSSPADPDLAGLVGRAAYQAEASESHAEVRPPPTKAGRRPTVSSTRDKNRERDRAAAAAAGAAAASQHEGPSWEKARRYEAYPSIKTRAGLSGISGVPTIAMLAGGVVLAAVILFFLPGVLGVGRDGGSGAAPSVEPIVGRRKSPPRHRRPRSRSPPRRSTRSRPATRSRRSHGSSTSRWTRCSRRTRTRSRTRTGSGRRRDHHPGARYPAGPGRVVRVAVGLARARRASQPLARRVGPAAGRQGYRGAMLMAVIRPASTRNVASMCWVGAPGRTTRRSAS